MPSNNPSLSNKIQLCSHLCWTDSLTEFTGDTPLLPRGVPPESVLPSEARAQGSLLKRVVNGGRLFEDLTQYDAKTCGTPH